MLACGASVGCKALAASQSQRLGLALVGDRHQDGSASIRALANYQHMFSGISANWPMSEAQRVRLDGRRYIRPPEWRQSAARMSRTA
jgi:hypothetical protein